MENSASQTPALPLGDFKRFGVMGGSFDPVHVGHISIAQQVMSELKLEQVFLMPAHVPPHKQDGRERASGPDRLTMCELAIHNMRGLSVSDYELKRGGVSYTVNTARELRAAYGAAAQIYFVIGSDSLNDLPQWYQIQELISLVDFAIADRREAPIQESMWEKIREGLGADAEKKLQRGVVSVQRVDISSTLIRQLLRSGEKIPGYLRRDVEDFIRQNGLYGATKSVKKR